MNIKARLQRIQRAEATGRAIERARLSAIAESMTDAELMAFLSEGDPAYQQTFEALTIAELEAITSAPPTPFTAAELREGADFLQTWKSQARASSLP